MAKLDIKKIDSLLKQIENIGKGAVRALNEMTDNSFVGSPFEKSPLENIGFIATTLQRARDQAQADAKYDGLDEDQIEEAKFLEREIEKDNLQKAVQEKLAKRQPAPEPTEEEPTSEPVVD